jgi:hypothetical protein
MTTRPGSDGVLSRPVFLSVLAVLFIAILLSAGFLIWRGENAPGYSSWFGSDKSFKFETLTSSDTPMTAAISPDGKYVAYSRTANGQQSLWLRQLSSSVNTQVIAPEEGVMYQGIEFSPDGEYIISAAVFETNPRVLTAFPSLEARQNQIF